MRIPRVSDAAARCGCPTRLPDLPDAVARMTCGGLLRRLTSK